MEKFDLGKLKEEYNKFQIKYALPSFDGLNKEFNIEKIAENETDFLLREIRKFIAEKSSNYLRFIEVILNPANAPMFIFSIVKSLRSEDREKLAEIYKQLSKNEIELINLDLEFSEEKDAKFINDFYRLWQEIKKELLRIVDAIGKNWDNKSEMRGKDYFG